MAVQFQLCQLDKDFDAYVKFLSRNYDELNLPYSYAMMLNFFASPLTMGKAMLASLEEPYTVVGAAGFVYGTSAKAYKDREICQIEVVYLLREYRTPMMFMRGLRALLREIRDGNPEVTTIQFWVSERHKSFKRLIARFSSLPGTVMEEKDGLMLYMVPFAELELFSRRFIPLTSPM
ncbi:hypothetical protein D3C75_981390 [compost metagenome]